MGQGLMSGKLRALAGTAWRCLQSYKWDLRDGCHVRFGRAWRVVCAAALAASLPWATALAQTAAQPEAPATAAGVIIKLKSGVASPALPNGLRRDRQLAPQTELWRFETGVSAAQQARLMSELAQHPSLQWVEPNAMAQRQDLGSPIPSDPMYLASPGTTGQWWLRPVSGSDANALSDRLRGVPGFQSAWQRSRGSDAVVIAVLDTGITPHSQLQGRILPGYDMISDADYAGDAGGRDSDPSDAGDGVSDAMATANPRLKDCRRGNSSWHGTIVAGLLVAATNDGLGVAGAMWSGKVLPVRVAGRCGAETADIIDGLRWAAGLPVEGVSRINPNPARIINISFGTAGACTPLYAETLVALRARGVLVVAAAGNDHAAPSRPANCPGVMGVAALNRDGFKASYSNFGPQLGLASVGGDAATQGAWGPLLGDDGLLTLFNLGTQVPGAEGYARVFGSSFAAPMVSATLGLMLAANNALTADQMVQGLQLSARPHVKSAALQACSASNPGRCACDSLSCGAGILDAEQAVLYALSPTSYVRPAGSTAPWQLADLNQAAALGQDLPANPGSMPTNTGGSDAGVAGGGAAAGAGKSGGGATDLSVLLGLMLAGWALRRCRCTV